MNALKNTVKTKTCGLIMALLLPLAAFSAPVDDYFTAIKNDNDSALVTVLFRGFDANTLDSQGRHGLHVAMMEGSLKVAKTLLDLSGTQVDVRNKSDETPLMLAVLKGRTEFVHKLIERGADVNKTGWTPLHYAATGGHVDLIELLLKHHAYIDAESPNKSTPLMMAAQYGGVKAVKILIDEGADMGFKNDAGLTALDFARMAESRDSFDLLEAELKEVDKQTAEPASTPVGTKPKVEERVAAPAVVVVPVAPPANKQPFKTRFDKED